MKTITLLILTLLFMSQHNERTETIYEYELKSIKGENISLEQYKGDVLLIANTASECGYTPQYKGLQALHDSYSDKGFNVLGFPANNFGGQEPGSDDEIKTFCEINYGVNFPLFSKISVKGDDIHPLFEYLTNAPNSDFTGEIGWNFEKFLVDRNGNLVRRFKSNVTPESDEIKLAIQDLLN